MLEKDTIPGGDSAKLTVRYNPATTGVHSATVRIISNDADEDTFTFAIRGEGMDIPLPDTLLSSNTTQGSDRLGYVVDINGNYAIAGAPLVSNKKGAAYVFFKNNGRWTEQAKLMASDSTENDKFGSAVAITGNYAIVGAAEVNDNGTFSGAAYIFERNGTTWTQKAKIVPSGNQAGDWYGYCVSIAGDYAVVGALGDDVNYEGQAGAAYMWWRNGSGIWVEQARLTASDAGANDYFGFAVDMTETDAIIGAHRNTDNGMHSGSAYIFHRSGSTWSQQAKLVAGDAAMRDSFGFSVSIHGEDALIGAVGVDDAANNAGAAYGFHRSGSTWSQQDKFTSNDASAGDEFGHSVSLESDSAFIGVYKDQPNGVRSGSSYLFTRSGSTWSQDRKLTAPSPMLLDDFGYSVGISNNFGIAGASGDDSKAANGGATYIYNLAYSPLLVRNNEYEKFTTELAQAREGAVLSPAGETEGGTAITEKHVSIADILLYPNPTKGEVNIAWPATAGEGIVEMIDASGKVVSRHSSKGQIQVTGLRMGVYTVRVYLGEDVYHRRLVVVK